MKNNQEYEYFMNVRKMIQDLLDKNSSRLNAESKSAVQHYIDHDEYEMAFEGLFIDLMELNEHVSIDDMNGYIEIGKSLGLDQDSVFDGNFWDKFIGFSFMVKLQSSKNAKK